MGGWGRGRRRWRICMRMIRGTRGSRGSRTCSSTRWRCGGRGWGYGWAGFQLGFHAIGDRAVEMALDAFAAAEKEAPAGPIQPQVVIPTAGPSFVVGRRDLRYRIEHSQVVNAGDFARYKRLGVIASMQPNHLLSDMAWAEQRLGPERSRYAYAWKSFLDAGVPLAYGTDYPVEPITPFRGVYASVTRMNEAGTATFHPEEKLNMWQTLYAYTQGSAYAEFAEQWK